MIRKHLSRENSRAVQAVIIALALISSLFFGSSLVRAQDVADTIKVNTRVVFLDALVKDKRTGVPISDLQPDNFEILDDGNPRAISYFTREGQARKPLALVLILDLRDSGAGRFLKRPEILKSMTDELAKLSPEDEVAIMAMDVDNDEERLWLSEFTRDHKQLVAALARAPEFVGRDDSPEAAEARARRQKERREQQSRNSLTLGAGPAEKTEKTEAVKETKGPESERVVRTDVVKGKNGTTINRTIKTDGTVDVKRVNKNGDITIEMSDVYDMAAAVQDTIRKAEVERPNSQLSIVWVSDGIAPIFFEDRDATEELVIRSNVIFNSMTTELRTLFKFLMPIGKPLAGWIGVSIYGSAKRLAKQSGGEAVRVNSVKDYGTGLSKIIGNLTARYSIGFALAEDERDDGRLHNLEVKVKAKDARGKTRKLEVNARKGYYMSETKKKEAAASREW